MTLYSRSDIFSRCQHARIHRSPRDPYAYGLWCTNKHHYLISLRVYMVPDVCEPPPLAHAARRQQCLLAITLSKSKDLTSLFLSILWYALYAWDVSFELLHKHVSELVCNTRAGWQSRCSNTPRIRAYLRQSYRVHAQSSYPPSTPSACQSHLLPANHTFMISRHQYLSLGRPQIRL